MHLISENTLRMQLIAGIITESQYNDSNVLNENIINNIFEKIKFSAVEKLVINMLKRFPEEKFLTLKTQAQELLDTVPLSKPGSLNRNDAEKFIEYFLKKVKRKNISEDIENDAKRQEYEKLTFITSRDRIVHTLKIMGLHILLHPFVGIIEKVAAFAGNLLSVVAPERFGDALEVTVGVLGYIAYIITAILAWVPYSTLYPNSKNLQNKRNQLATSIGLSDEDKKYDDEGGWFWYGNPKTRKKDFFSN